MDREEIIKRLETLKTIYSSHSKRLEFLKNFKSEIHTLKWTKQTYDHIKDGLESGLREINHEIQLWTELYNGILEDDPSELLPEISQFLKSVGCTKDDTLIRIAESIEGLEEEQNRYLDVQISINKLIRDLQRDLDKLLPYQKIAIQKSPTAMFDMTVMDIQLPKEKKGSPL